MTPPGPPFVPPVAVSARLLARLSPLNWSRPPAVLLLVAPSQTKFWSFLYGFVTPVPETRSALPGKTANVYSLASESKEMLSIEVGFWDTEIPVMFDTPKFAMPSGTTAGVQFSALFQSPLTGSSFQVASVAKLL